MRDLSANIFPPHWGAPPQDEEQRATWIRTNVRRWHVRPGVAAHSAVLELRRRGYDLDVEPEALSGRAALRQLFAKAVSP